MGTSGQNRNGIIAGILLALLGLVLLLTHDRLFSAILPFAVENASLDHRITATGELKIHCGLYALAVMALLAAGCVASTTVRAALSAMHFSDPAFPALAESLFTRRVFWTATLGGLVISLLWAFSEGLGIADHYLEDEIFENAATAATALATVLLIQPVLYLFREHRATPQWKQWRWLIAFYILIGAGFFVIAGEEISLGQRVFGWETPEKMVEINEQDETNLHNLYNEYFVQIYYGFAGIIPFHIAAMVLPFRKRDSRFASMLLPHPSLNILALMIAVNSAFLWRGELTEELLALYCVLYTARVFFGTRRTYGAQSPTESSPATSSATS